MGYFAGIDLGKRKSQIKVISADRKTVEELKVENDPRAFAAVFRKYKGDIEVGCEASSNAFWVADAIAPLVRKVLVGHPTKIRWIAEARIKTDRIDAGILAELVRVDLFPSICIPPRRIRDLRELVRGMIRLRRQGTRFRNQIHGLLSRQGIRYERAESAGSRLSEVVREAELPPPARTSAEAILRLEQATRAEELHLQAAIREELKQEPELKARVELLESIPGVGMFSALLFIVELWDLRRFADERHLASYIGFVPGTHQTGETLRMGGMTRQGNVLARWILVQDAWVATRNSVFFGRLYERHKTRKGKTRAIVPVARALLNTIYRVWIANKPYPEVYSEKTLVG